MPNWKFAWKMMSGQKQVVRGQLTRYFGTRKERSVDQTAGREHSGKPLSSGLWQRYSRLIRTLIDGEDNAAMSGIYGPLLAVWDMPAVGCHQP